MTILHTDYNSLDLRLLAVALQFAYEDTFRPTIV